MAEARIAVMEDNSAPSPTQNEKLPRWRRIFHINTNVLAVLLQRAWNILGGGVTILLVPIWLTQVEQGYYYAFFGVLALQVFFDLGINFIVVQMVAHEAAWLKISADGHVTGDAHRIARIASLDKLLRRWYLVAAILFFSALLVGGFPFFNSKGTLPSENWLPAWAGLVFFTSINLYYSPALALVEGVGRIAPVARLRLVQSIAGYVTTWSALALGAGLHAVYLLPCVSALIAIWWVHKNRLKIAPPIQAIKSNRPVQWRVDILPLQWRIAVSWLSGYLIFNAFTPFIFAHQGAVEAGKLGIGLSVFTSLSNLVMSWSNAAMPEMIGMISRGERKALRALFFRVLRSSLAFSVVSCTAVVVIVALLPSVGFAAASSRIVPVPTLVCLAVANITNSVIFAAAIYMRAHKQEPMLWPSLVMGLLNIAALYFASKISSFLPVALFASITLFIGLPWTLFLLRPYINRSRISDKAEGTQVEELTPAMSKAASSLTICIACYNRPEYAKEAIQSALDQTNNEFSLLISDNSTISNVGEMVREHFPSTPYIRRTPQLKACEHFNQILSECNSDYVMLMHDDDLLAPQFVEQMRQLISKFPGRKCYASNASVVDATAAQKRKRFYLSFGEHQLLRSPLQLTQRWFAYATFSVAPFPSYIYDRCAVANTRFDAQKFGQFIDYGFIHGCLLDNGSIAWLNRPLYRYRLHESQDSAGIKFTSYTKVKNYIKQQHPDYYKSNAFSLTRASMLTAFPQLKRHSLLRRKVQSVKMWKIIATPQALIRKLTLSVAGRLD